MKLFLIPLLFCAATLHADTIFLKNGRQISCISAVEDGDLVRYVIPAGSISIPRNIVERIEKNEFKPEPAQPRRSKPPEKDEFQVSPQLIPPSPDQSSGSQNALANSYTISGIELAKQGNLAEALDKFQKAHELRKDSTTKLNLGLTYFALRDDSAAEMYFEQVVAMDPKNVLALNYLGRIAWRREDLDAAVSYWERSFEIRPDPEMEERLARLKKERSVSARYENAPSSHFLLKYDGGSADPQLVGQISDFLEETYQRLCSIYEVYPSEPFVVTIYPRQEFFRATDAPRWSAGLNDGKIHVPLKGIGALTAELQAHLIHELSHSFVDVKTGENCPAWLHEGLAQYSEGKRLRSEELQALSRLVSGRQLPPIAGLEGSFASADAQLAVVLYLQSLAFVQYLSEKHGFYQLNLLLERLGEGKPYLDAFEETFLLPLSQIESDWRRELSNS